jgi:hypothetical protein
MKNKGYRITVVLAFAWTVLLPFLWAYRLSIEFGLASSLAFLAYRPEFLAVLPCAILLVGAWQMRRWAIPGLCFAALALPVLKLTQGGASHGAWAVGALLFASLALRLWSVLKPNVAMSASDI